ncbi:adhesive plaque matrix protein [Nematolebias whitei]|uniref:adhesive plaque matrix protein n=1 Tax=Nematolebias whitei TaxID=451745 RepID=UPI001896E6EA|nr:adhesive plaque matrix protein [Nematolebias whitei]
MSCPMIEHVSSNPPMITCHAEGMVVQTEWTNSASNIKANINGNWEPLLTAARRCAFGIVEHPEGVVISVRFAPCLRKKDGLYTFELAADKETKISCPSLLAADIKSTDFPKAPLQQSEKPSGWMTPFSTPYPSLSPRSGQTGSQIPNFPQSQDLPSKPNQVPKGFDPSFFYSYFYPYSGSPETTHTKPLHILTPTNPANTQNAGADFHFPINQLPAFLPMWPPVTKSPPPKHEVDQYQFHLSPKLPLKTAEPPSSYPKGQEQGHPDQFSDTQTSPQTLSYPLYLEKLPEKPGKLHTLVSEKPQPEENLPLNLICTQQISASKLAGASQGQVSQPFYLLCTQLKLALNTASQQPHHKIPQGQEYHTFFLSCTQDTQASKPMSQPLYTESGQMYQSLYLLCTLLRQSSQPTGVTWPPQHEALQTYRYRAFFPYYVQLQPTSKPDVTQPPQPRTPQGQVYQQFSFYTQSKPTPKPAEPQQPATPQGQSFQQFFQFFTQPQPTLKPADITQPPLPNASPSQVYKHLLDYFYQLKQAHKPAVTPPPNPATPQGQAYQSLLDYLIQQNQTPKPDIQSPQPATPEDQIYQPIFHFHTPLKQTPKSAVTLPPLPATLQGQAHLPLLHYFSLKPTQKSNVTPPPKPATPQGQAYQPLLDYFTQLKSTSKPAVTQPLQPSTPRSQAYQHSFRFPTKSKLTSIPTVSEPSDLDIPQGPVNQPFSHLRKPELQLISKPSDPLPEPSHSQMYQLLHPYQLHTHPKPVKEPTLVPQPSQPAVLQGEAHQMCLYDQLLTESQIAKMPTDIILGKVLKDQRQWSKGN